MNIQLQALLVAVAFVTFSTRFLRRSSPTAGLRKWATNFSPWTAKLFSCPHCLGFWLALPCAGLLAIDWLNFAIMLLLSWRGSFHINRLFNNLTIRSPKATDRQCHVCDKPYKKDFLYRLNRNFCSYPCWFDHLKDQHRSARPIFSPSGEFIRQEVYPMSYQNLSPNQANELLSNDSDTTYIDVRSMPEYENGHPAGSLNIPVMHREAMGMVPNLEFVRVLQSHFDLDAKLLIGCQSGARSVRASEALIAAGFTNITNVTGGYGGARNQAGEVIELGWMESGLPVEYGAEGDTSYPALVSVVNE